MIGTLNWEHFPVASLSVMKKKLKIRLVIFITLALCGLVAFGQTPIANRVKAVAKNLPRGAKVVAKYTDNQRHCLYYIYDNRLFRHDVMTNRCEEAVFSSDAYHGIASSWLSPDGNFFFLVVDRGASGTAYWNAGQVLWRYDSHRKQSYKVGEGFEIEHRKGCNVIKRGTQCLNPHATTKRQRWMAKDHYYDLYGKVIWSKDEYEVKQGR